MKTIVQAAISGLLVQLGHTVTRPSDDADLLVLAAAPEGVWTIAYFPRGKFT
ncbi:hypothetical protein [Streptomyces sp. NPDC050856]|uniref:hypothetical protein n=1 Tax=Streptomyces sp. NPDC050856 TaxID=3154939 RepID=UPI0033E0C04C